MLNIKLLMLKIVLLWRVKMNIKKGLIAGIAVLGLSMTAQASTINVGGVVWDPDVGADFDASSSIYEDALNPGPDGLFFTADDVNTTVSGYGKITSVNGTGPSTFCPGCELTFVFGGYALSSAITDATGETEFEFSGGWVRWYVDHTPNLDTTNPSTLLESQATDGDLWLSMVGHDFTHPITGRTYTLAGDADFFGTGNDAGDGKGLLDVITDPLDPMYGMANSNFDTNAVFDSLGVGADMFFSSTFGPARADQVTADGKVLEGDVDFTGNSIPEPSSIALLGLGLLGFAASRKKKA